MRRDLRILVVTTVIAAGAQWGPGLPDALSRMDTFLITEVDVRGQRFLSEEAVIAQLALSPQASIWTDQAILEERMLLHPMVREVEITRRVPHGLLVTITERQPIALAPTPTLEPVDAVGNRLPVDPAAYRLDLPIIATSRTPPAGARVFPEDVRELAAEIEHLMNTDIGFAQMVSSIRRDRDGNLVARWTEPPVEFLLPSRPSPARLREGLGALSNAISRTPDTVPDVIDLRFADQVVVRRARK